MSNRQTLIKAFIEDVNREDGFFLPFCNKITGFLFFLIKWAGIPFVAYLLFTLAKL